MNTFDENTVTPNAKGAKVRLKVVDQADNPVGNISVTACCEGASVSGVTDRNGRAAFPKVPISSEVQITVEMPECEVFHTTVVCTADEDEHIITLPVTCVLKSAIQFQLKTPAGKVIKGVPLELSYQEIKHNDLTDEEGSALFQDIPVGEVVVLTYQLPGKPAVQQKFRCQQGENFEQIIIEKAIKKRYRYVLMVGIGIVAAALFMMIFLFLRDEGRLPESAGFIPVNPKRWVIDPDDPLKTTIAADRLLIMLEENIDLYQFAENLKQQFPGRELRLLGHRPEYDLIQARVPASKRAEWRSIVASLPGVSAVLYDSLLVQNHVPKDSGFQDKTDNKSWAYHQIRGFEAWEISLGDRRTIIAVLGTGFDLEHEELKGKIIYPKNVLYDESKLRKTIFTDQGTHLAAVSAGNADNEFGVCGVCPECRIMPIQVADKKGHVSDTTIINGLFYAGRYGARVVVIPFGAKFGDDIPAMYHGLTKDEQENFRSQIKQQTAQKAAMWNRVFEAIIRKGAVIVQSAGNEAVHTDLDPLKRSEASIIVGSVSRSNQRSEFSNYGENVVLYAPGESVYNAVKRNEYAFLSGTSIAAAMTGGAVGLIKSLRPELSHQLIQKILTDTGVHLIPGGDLQPANVIIQVNLALEQALKYGGECHCLEEIEQLWQEIRLLKQQINQLTTIQPDNN